jgi:phosphoglucomutase
MEAKGEMGCSKCYESAKAAADAKFDGIKKSLGI